MFENGLPLRCSMHSHSASRLENSGAPCEWNIRVSVITVNLVRIRLNDEILQGRQARLQLQTHLDVIYAHRTKIRMSRNTE